ncbi:hypothetical protein KSP39_PZI019796 [Platanthera zijinensis]|uniref:Uncharacterized protein n=1 Tax=Platanthera zijinensis TaxID=2320716 RepID=A0AAP0B1A4_9ASPA
MAARSIFLPLFLYHALPPHISSPASTYNPLPAADPCSPSENLLCDILGARATSAKRSPFTTAWRNCFLRCRVSATVILTLSLLLRWILAGCGVKVLEVGQLLFSARDDTTMDFQCPLGVRGNVSPNLVYEGEVLLAVGSCFSYKGSSVIKMEATQVIMGLLNPSLLGGIFASEIRTLGFLFQAVPNGCTNSHGFLDFDHRYCFFHAARKAGARTEISERFRMQKFPLFSWPKKL